MKLANIHLILGDERKKHGLSQKDVADALTVEQATVSMYENGKRGIPLDILDQWLNLLDIEIKIIPKGYEPVKPAQDTKDDLKKFNSLKRRRNFLFAEMRAMMAENLMSVPEFRETEEESGEDIFWPYSFCGDPAVGLVETRYDHPEQKFLAVEYTKDEVNVYKFLTEHEVSDGESDGEWLKISRIYFSEDDFLTFGELWDQDSMDMRKVTILRKNKRMPDGVEIVGVEGFSVRSLLEMQENFVRFLSVVNKVEKFPEYERMEDELDVVMNELGDLSLGNRLENGTMNPDFIYWTEEDKEACDVPLWSDERCWKWVREGLEWREDLQESREIQVEKGELLHDCIDDIQDEAGNRVIGLIGEDRKPAVFKSNPTRPDAIYRVAVAEEDLNEAELASYRAVLNATLELAELPGLDKKTEE